MIARAVIFLLAALPDAAVTARDIRLCFTEREFLPVSSPAFEAPGQYLARRAIESVGDRAVMAALPWRRCVDGVRHGEYDGAIGMVATESFLAFMRFPEADGIADPSKSLGDLVYVAARRSGSAADWDGHDFAGLHLPVIYNAPSLALADKMRRLGAGNPNASLSEEQMLTMLAAGRADLAVGRKDVFEALLAGESFRGKVELLPQPFLAAASYLAFRDPFADRFPGHAEKIWAEIGRLKSAADWSETRQRLLSDRRPLNPS